MEKESLGLIETVGLTPAIEAADAGSKAANVVFRGIERARAGLITVMFVGDVAAVRAAVTAGSAAARLVGKVVSVHVIARPDRQLHMARNGAGATSRAVPAPATTAAASKPEGADAPRKSEEASSPTLQETEERVEANLEELTPEATRALDAQVESIVEESECVGVVEVSVEEAAEVVEEAEEEQPQPAAETAAAEEAPPDEEPEAVTVGRTPAARKKEKEKARKPKSKRKF